MPGVLSNGGVPYTVMRNVHNSHELPRQEGGFFFPEIVGLDQFSTWFHAADQNFQDKNSGDRAV